MRIVEFPGTHICACCGTHVKATGEIGLVKIVSCVKFRQGVRMEMVSGARAVAYLSRAYEQNRQVSQAFSAKIMETGEAARKMNEALNAEKFRITGLQWQLFDHVAECVESLYMPQGGLGLSMEFNFDVSLENMAAVLDAVEKYSHYKG